MAKSPRSKADQKLNKKEILVGENRKARHEYEILDSMEAGMVLRGTEVKVLRQGHISIGEAMPATVKRLQLSSMVTRASATKPPNSRVIGDPSNTATAAPFAS